MSGLATRNSRQKGQRGPAPATPFRHWIDRCTQHEFAGWSTAPTLIVAVNGRVVGSVAPNIQRDDLVTAGIEAGYGFRFLFDQPLWINDEIVVAGPDGSEFRGRLDDDTDRRIRELTRYIDVGKQVGLEIGPLDRPLIPKSLFHVYYMDQASGVDLKSRYGNQGVNLSALVEPDFVVGQSSFASAVGSRQFHYCIASHVIEHIPDMIGWLWEIWSVLKDGGVLSLAVPHGEKTFDAKRRLSSMAELVDAYFGRLTQPSTRQIIDAQIGAALYYDKPDLETEVFRAFHLTNHARKVGLYADIHCNVFTPASFAENLRYLDKCELLGFDLISIGYRGDDEFIVHLRKSSNKSLPDHIRP